MVTLVTVPSDVIGDDLAKLKGLLGTLSAVSLRWDGECLDPEDLAWALIVMNELVIKIKKDLIALEEWEEDEPEETEEAA